MAKILIVEDNEMNLDMLSRRLERRGYEIVIATDGAQGVELAKSEHPDLILMDMSLPIMDGWTATKNIKAEDALKNTPIIALTAHAIAGDREKALAAGCDEYETKPVKFPKLLTKIEQFLNEE
jgi:CheY-like chemotaxis protein